MTEEFELHTRVIAVVAILLSLLALTLGFCIHHDLKEARLRSSPSPEKQCPEKQ